MSTGTDSPSINAARRVASSSQIETRFFVVLSLAILLTVFGGFARSYFLRSLHQHRSLSPLVHVHGIVFTAWILLFVTQIQLIRTDRTVLHRRVGIAGAALAVSMIVIGFEVAVRAAKRDLTRDGGVTPLSFLAIALGDLAVFAVLAGVGIGFRRRPAFHKRLMLLATIALLPPAVGRLPFAPTDGAVWFFGITDLFVLACLLFDKLVRERIHPAFLYGGIFLIVSQPIRTIGGTSELWLVVAQWLIANAA